MKQKLSRFWLVMVMTVCLTALLPATAFAGSNGQQLSIYVCNATSLQIQGTNQYGSYIGVSVPVSTSCGWKYIYNRWWKGTVAIKPVRPYMSSPTTFVSVPTLWWDNWYYVKIG